jgi:hypothetical protein
MEEMTRLSVIKALIKQKDFKNYLEIGVFNGHVFFRVPSFSKVAVDPEFRFDAWRKLGKMLVNPSNAFNKYFEVTSDDFFATKAPELYGGKKIGLALVDGMHQYEYALRDVENILKFATGDVVIILHDCNPASAEAASTFEEWKSRNFSHRWNGDVWKAIVHLRSLRNDLTSFVLDTDFGLGVVVRKTNERPLRFSPDQIGKLTYEDLNRNRNEWLDLRPPAYFFEFFGLQQ